MFRLGFLVHVFLLFLFGCVFKFWPAPGARETLPNVLRLRRRTFGRVSGAPGVAQTPKIVILQSSNNLGSFPPLPTRAKRSKSGSFGDDPISTCLTTVKICKKVKENRQNRQNPISTCLKTGGPLRGPSGAPPGPHQGPSGALRAPPGPPDFWCNRHCKTSPVVLEGCWGQVWPKIGRKPLKSTENRKNPNTEVPMNR